MTDREMPTRPVEPHHAAYARPEDFEAFVQYADELEEFIKAPPVLQEETGTRELVRGVLDEVRNFVIVEVTSGREPSSPLDDYVDRILAASLPTGEGRARAQGEVMAQALVDIHDEVEAVADEIRPYYDDLVKAVVAVERLSREALPKGTLEGWGNEASDG